MRRFVIVIGLFAALGAGMAEAGGARPFAADREGWDAACNTFVNRARFLPREEPVAFVTLLAEACEGALASLDSREPAQRDAAARFLTRLSAFRDVVKTMNVERVYGPAAGPASKPASRPRAMGAVGHVSATGEYLIAREMGVQRALSDWLDTGVAFSLASR